MPSPMNTPTPFSPPQFVFPNANPLALHLTTLPSHLSINCTVTWEGDLSQLTTMWSYNGRMITNSQKYVITERRLLILEFTLLILEFTSQDVGTYECTVKDPLEWSASRQYSVSTDQGKQQHHTYGFVNYHTFF